MFRKIQESQGGARLPHSRDLGSNLAQSEHSGDMLNQSLQMLQRCFGSKSRFKEYFTKTPFKMCGLLSGPLYTLRNNFVTAE